MKLVALSEWDVTHAATGYSQTEGVNQMEVTKRKKLWQLLHCKYVKIYLILIDILLLVPVVGGESPIHLVLHSVLLIQ